MNTYFSTDITKATDWKKKEILDTLSKIAPSDCLATIQWNCDDNSLYGVSYLDESVDNASNNGCIWYYEPASELLAEVKAQL